MLDFVRLHPSASVHDLGFVFAMMSDLDPRPAREQINEYYAHGGGWNPMPEWERLNPNSFSIRYPGDPGYLPLWLARLHGDNPDLPTEVICVYQFAWVGIFQPDGSFEVSRMD